MTSINLPSLDWVVLLTLIAPQMQHMTEDEKTFCLKFARQVRHQTTDQAFDQHELDKDKV